MHPFMPSVLLRRPEIDPHGCTSQLDPPLRQFRQASQCGRTERCPIVGNDLRWYAVFAKDAFERRLRLGRRRRTTRADVEHISTKRVRDRQRITRSTVDHSELPFVVSRHRVTRPCDYEGRVVDRARAATTWPSPLHFPMSRQDLSCRTHRKEVRPVFLFEHRDQLRWPVVRMLPFYPQQPSDFLFTRRGRPNVRSSRQILKSAHSVLSVPREPLVTTRPSHTVQLRRGLHIEPPFQHIEHKRQLRVHRTDPPAHCHLPAAMCQYPSAMSPVFVRDVSGQYRSSTSVPGRGEWSRAKFAAFSCRRFCVSLEAVRRPMSSRALVLAASLLLCAANGAAQGLAEVRYADTS